MNNLLKKGWRNKNVLTGITILLIIITAFISIFLSLMIAQNQAVTKETRRLREITEGVLMRMTTTRAQFSNVVNYFSAVAQKDACAPKNIQKMQELNIDGFFLQAVAHVKDNRIECSSTSEIFDGLELGKPLRIEPDGTRVWANIKIADWKNHHLVVLERSGWAIAFVPSHAIAALGNAEISVGVFGIQAHKLYTARGEVFPEWFQGYDGKQALTFVDKKRHMLVYMAPNQLNMTGVVAAMSLKDINEDIVGFIQILIPLAMVVGISLGGIFVYMQRTRYSTKSAILRALANNEFYLEYQPIMDLQRKTCVGAEALIRWRTSDNTFISPDTFIPAAEASGVICQITQRVFELVAKDMHTALNMHKDFHVGINISSHDIRSGHLLSMIETLKKSTGAQGKQILIEVTERGFLDDDEALKTIKNIRDCGVMVAIDDFGTGYSSLSYLTKFQLDYLKIDKTFVDSVGTDAVTSHVAFHIIEMAKTLKLDMVAEGVETEEQATILRERGVNFVQGWLFSKSLKRKDFYTYLEKHTQTDDQASRALLN
jgi:sensor c-di-GMP phosphodiesterase-like protein